jgi:hypothetical protein
MRINVYTEELLTVQSVMARSGEMVPPLAAEIVTADYTSSRTGKLMTNYGLRIYLKSAPELHYIPGRDDDRSAITFWCGNEKQNVTKFLDLIRYCLEQQNLVSFRSKVEDAQKEL